MQDFDTLMEELSNFARRWYVMSNCPFIRSAFLDIVGLCGMAMLQRTDTLSILHAWENLTASVSIGPQYALGFSGKNGEALLRASLAHVFFIDRIIVRDGILSFMLSETHQGIGEALMLLATEDPDTCCAALETLDAVIRIRPSSELIIPLSLVLAHVHRVVLEATDAEVISKAQAVLTNGLADNDLKGGFFSLVTEEQVLITLGKLENQCLDGPPCNAQSALHLLGFFLDFAFHACPAQRRPNLKAIARYIRLLRMTIIDTNPFDARFAAVQSIHALEHIWTASTTSKSTGPILIGLTFILYDLLNDDDDEIRDLAALAATNLFRAQRYLHGTHTVPLLTTHHIAAFLSSTTFASSHIFLVKHALHRLTSNPSAHTTYTNEAPLFSTSFSTLLAQQSHLDTALFATEKQNLYKDDALDAVFWSRIVRCMPGNCVPLDVRNGLETWVRCGIADLTERAELKDDDRGEVGVDGPLGWTSKSEVFTLGIRVLCPSEVVLQWTSSSDSYRRNTAGRDEVLKALRRFADRGGEAGVHGLWLERVERVLEKEVLGALRRVKGSLGAV